MKLERPSYEHPLRPIYWLFLLLFSLCSVCIVGKQAIDKYVIIHYHYEPKAAFDVKTFTEGSSSYSYGAFRAGNTEIYGDLRVHGIVSVDGYTSLTGR